ncbi:hypothetical protein FRC20_003168 [Serendipita sp. 405]|nr:hypothetical protein FRC20_003168 [Serendipita sp. 405]
MSQTGAEHSGATHFLLAHLSVKPTEWLLRRQFPVAPGFRPSSVILHYPELDRAARTAIHEHLRHVNGSEDDMASVNWSLNSCWRLHDVDEWFSFAIILECLPIARAISSRTIIAPNPKPRVLYHLSSPAIGQTDYILEHHMPVSEAFDPSSSNSGFSAMTYDICDPGGRKAIAQVIERANYNETDLLRKPWGLISITRISPSSKKSTAAGARSGLAIVLQWQPGELGNTRQGSTINGDMLATSPMAGLSRPMMNGLAISPSRSSSSGQAADIQSHMITISPPEYTA